MSKNLLMLGIHPQLVCSTAFGPAPTSAASIGRAQIHAVSVGGENEEFEAFLCDMLDRRPPASKAPTHRRPQHRHWPAPERPIPMHSAVILSRRPELADVFPEAVEKAEGRSPRTAGSGLQNRLPSLKAGRTIRCASNLEFAHALDCEISSSISRIEEQPCTLRYVLEGQSRIAKPDAFVVERGVFELREIKHEKRAAEPENEARWKAIAAAVNSMGLGYRVVTEDDLGEGGRLDAIRTVFEHRQSPHPSDFDLACLKELLADGALTLRNCATGLPCIQRDQIFALVRRGVLALDLSRPISSDTLVMLPAHWTGVQFGGPG